MMVVFKPIGYMVGYHEMIKFSYLNSTTCSRDYS